MSVALACACCGTRLTAAGPGVRCPRCGQPAGPAPAVDAAGPTQVLTEPPADATQADPPGPRAAPRYDFLAPPAAAGELGRIGTFRVLGVLGRGGMGVVFRAEDTRLKRLVALKVMLPEAAASPTAK